MRRHLGLLLLLVLVISASSSRVVVATPDGAILETSPAYADADIGFVLRYVGTGFPPGAYLILGLVDYTSSLNGVVGEDGSFDISVSYNIPKGNYHPFVIAQPAASDFVEKRTILHVR